MWKCPPKKEETPQLNKVLKVFFKNGNASKIRGNALKKKEERPQLNKVFKVLLKNGNASKKKEEIPQL